MWGRWKGGLIGPFVPGLPFWVVMSFGKGDLAERKDPLVSSLSAGWMLAKLEALYF